MKPGCHTSGLAGEASCNAIWGKRKAPLSWVSSCSRACGPPASSTQYHEANTRTLLNHSDAADSSNSVGLSLRLGSNLTSRTTEATNATVTTQFKTSAKTKRGIAAWFRTATQSTTSNTRSTNSSKHPG